MGVIGGKWGYVGVIGGFTPIRRSSVVFEKRDKIPRVFITLWG